MIAPQQDRLSDLNIQHQDTVEIKKGYSWFVKIMRLALPLVAIILIFVVIALPQMKEQLVIVPKEEIIEQTNNDIGENELLNPHFETIDSNQNPVNVTAARAVQNQDNPKLVKLDQPKADLQMADGSKVQIMAAQGTYEQETEKLFLQDNVSIKHASGYELKAEELRVDMQTREAFSDKAVQIDGPAAKINAIGLKGNVDEGTLLFKGPIKLILKTTTTKSMTKPLEETQNDDAL